MRSIWRTLDRDLARDIALVCVADGIVGASFGAIAVSSGAPLWLPMLLSVVVFAGAAQFIFVGLVASGGGLAGAVIASLLVNARHVPFGFAVGDLLGKTRTSRLIGTHLILDESVAFALTQKGFQRRRAAYWGCGVLLFGCWNVGTVIGAFGGTAISDTDALGLDAAFPAVLLALLLPSLNNAATRRAALVGVLIALAAEPFVPAGMSVLLALFGVLAGLGRSDDAGATSEDDGCTDPYEPAVES